MVLWLLHIFFDISIIFIWMNHFRCCPCAYAAIYLLSLSSSFIFFMWISQKIAHISYPWNFTLGFFHFIVVFFQSSILIEVLKKYKEQLSIKSKQFDDDYRWQIRSVHFHCRILNITTKYTKILISFPLIALNL